MTFQKFFSKIQEANWYRSFLDPVINEIGDKGELLDIGTGSGKLIQIVSNEIGINCTGVDTDSEMLDEARIKLKENKVNLIQIEADKKFLFANNSFTYITVCNVLFHLKTDSIDFLLKEVQRILKRDGKIIILTPTGKGNFLTLTKHYFSLSNLSIYVWFYATRNRARIWNKNKYLEQYTKEYNLHYESTIVMNGFAQLEIIKA